MARQFVYFMQGLSKTYPPNRKVLDNIHLSFYPDAKIGVLGVNGSGKSTLLKIMAGLDKDYTGEAWVAEGARVGYLEQEPQLDASKTVRENVMMGVAKQKAILDRYNELAVNYSEETADEMTKLQDEIEAAGLWDLDSKVDQAMDALRCPPDDADVTKLSGGERRRVALCRLLLDQPELLLLDEPTNHLDAESVSWLEGHLRNYPGAILIVTHDRYFLDNVTGWILELDRGRGIPYEGNYSSWLVQKQKRLEQEGREEASLLQPEGIYGPSFLATKNYFVIKEYNFSDLYVLFVGHLADRMTSPLAFATPWSASTQLRTRDVEAMQRGLTRIGLYADKIDGKAGMLTRAALGAYQKKAGLKVDCWPSEAVLRSIEAAR